MISSNKFPDALQNGTLLLQYRIEGVLGQGGFGITYLAQDTRLKMFVAIKEFFPRDIIARSPNGDLRVKSASEFEPFEKGKRGFLAEAQTLAKFKHPNIIQIYNFFEDHNTAYMVMDFEEGESLSELLNNSCQLQEHELMDILLPLLSGLEVLHSTGYIHRDIKPSNIYIRKDKTPVFLDFGLARDVIGIPSKNITTLFTPGYAPIEQYHSSSKKQGPWTDIYAMGAILYRAISGSAPEHATDRSMALLEQNQDPVKAATIVGDGRYSQSFLEAIDKSIQILEKKRPKSVDEWRQMLVKNETQPPIGHLVSNAQHDHQNRTTQSETHSQLEQTAQDRPATTTCRYADLPPTQPESTSEKENLPIAFVDHDSIDYDFDIEIEHDGKSFNVLSKTLPIHTFDTIILEFFETLVTDLPDNQEALFDKHSPPMLRLTMSIPQSIHVSERQLIIDKVSDKLTNYVIGHLKTLLGPTTKIFVYFSAHTCKDSSTVWIL